ncbi:spore germination protein GerPB [Longirhabdus pacifica]|uniref:spore germination protein GerPB n=1 Tax=Longirhabdus pacifica TaxID=2305227 RepID=UPI001008D5BE|nr:spore germination protein GerPB [Longirhabdus pacifica]
MSVTIYQQICINNLKINAITNSSVLQIGTAGNITSNSTLSNSGGFEEAAEQLEAQQAISLVPLPQIR